MKIAIRKVICAGALFSLAGCSDWTGGFMTNPPGYMPLGTCLENRLACNEPEKPKKSEQQAAQPQPTTQTQQPTVPPEPDQPYQP